MDSKELKKVIKHLVRESLTEIFMEMKLESIVENVLRKQAPKERLGSVHSPLIRESIEVSVEPEEDSEELAEKERERKANLRKVLLEKMGDANDALSHIYDDVDMDNPIITGENNAQELVSESVMRQTGMMRDFSKFVK